MASTPPVRQRETTSSTTPPQSGRTTPQSGRTTPQSPGRTTPQPQSARTVRQQVLRRNAQSLDERIDRELVSILLSAKRFLKFTDTCCGREHIFGDPGSSLRKRVHNRRAFLLALQTNDPQAFRKLAKELALTAPDTTANSSPESSESSSSASEESSKSSEASPRITSSTTMSSADQHENDGTFLTACVTLLVFLFSTFFISFSSS
jgi:hypothetical protein